MAYDLRTREIRYVTEGTDFFLVESGRHRGRLLVLQRKLVQVGEPRFYNVYWLYSADGSDLGIAGPENMDVSSLRCAP
jgi:hypothetical protein